jgi:hypothetical protein
MRARVLARSRAVLFAGLLAGLLAVVALGGPAAAQDTGGNKPDVPVQHMIPRPDSGQKPEDAGDRGGALQLALLGLVCVVLVGGTLHVVRLSRRARAEQGDLRGT